MRTNELRQKFLEYFKQNKHTVVPSSSLIPGNDPTLLFTNAGMVQFKDVFLGNEPRPYTRAASSQRCVRAGGKHNDLENVGYTARHHTFFEMLGNFSFGDYFKRDAIYFAWNFLTQVLQIPAEKLWVTVFENDDEAADIWLKDLKVDPNRFSRCGEKDNFWSMGETGPCGPCTELFYDHGPDVPGGPPGSPEADGDRYIEIWNLVFMQFNRTADGKLHPLPKPSVDTGMGLERIAAVMQGVHSNYEIDIFARLIKFIADLAKTKDLQQSSLKVIADHIRSTAFLITDGVIPSNEGRGYVLRRIIRRAIRHGHKVGFREAFFYQLVAPLVAEMGEAYPELKQAQERVTAVIKREEEQFAYTLEQGLRVLQDEIASLKNNVIPGAVVFKLYDTYGFPPDLTADIARERQLTLDYAGFEREMDKQRKQSQASSQFAVDYNAQVQIEGETEFTGYEHLNDEGVVRVIVKDSQLVDELKEGEQGAIILDRTPFYAEAGGQVGDKGQLIHENGVFEVKDTQKQGLVYFHHGMAKQGSIRVGTRVSAEVSSTRVATMLNHSATHLLHEALKRILGEHVIQKGSLVAADRLRFDFAHFAPVSAAELKKVERLVNQQIQANLDCHIDLMTPEQAKQKGAVALFGEKYGGEVRVLSMGEFSMELCGGTHTKNTGQIGLFKIISETGISAGIRRIEAITGEVALDWVDQQETKLKQAADLLKTSSDDLVNRLQQLLQEQKNSENELNNLRRGFWADKVAEWIKNADAHVKIIVQKVSGLDANILRTIVDQFKERVEQGVIVIASQQNDKANFIVGVTASLAQKVRANEIATELAKATEGKGGGRPDLAQGGTEHVEKLMREMDLLKPKLADLVKKAVGE